MLQMIFIRISIIGHVQIKENIFNRVSWISKRLDIVDMKYLPIFVYMKIIVILLLGWAPLQRLSS